MHMSRTRALSQHARTVLAVLLEARGEWSHGYELARLADVRSGTLYPLLIRLEAQGHLEAEWQQPVEGGDRRGTPTGSRPAAFSSPATTRRASLRRLPFGAVGRRRERRVSARSRRSVLSRAAGYASAIAEAVG